MRFRLDKNKWLLLAICIGPFFSLTSIGLVNVALPELTLIFNENVETMRWLTLGYLIIIPILIPIMGKLSDLTGPRLIHNSGFLVFGISSILIALSPTIHFIIFFRLFQGLGAAMFQSTNIALVSMSVPKNVRGKAYGILGSSVALGTMVGPAIGGLIIHYLPWHFVFLFPVPFCLFGYILAQKFIRTGKVERMGKKFDVIGAFQFSLFVTLIILFVNFMTEFNSIIIMGFIIIISLLFIIMKRYLSQHEDPFIDLSLFKNPIIKIGIFISFSSFVASFTITVILPFHMQGILLLDPYVIGFIMMSYPIILGMAGPIFGTISDNMNPQIVLVSGLIVMSISLLSFVAIGKNASILFIIFLLGLLGLGMGMITSPNYSLVMKWTSPDTAGVVGSLIALARTVGNAVGASFGFMMMNVWISKAGADFTDLLSKSNDQLAPLALKGLNASYIILGVLILFTVSWFWFELRNVEGKMKEKSDKTFL